MERHMEEKDLRKYCLELVVKTYEGDCIADLESASALYNFISGGFVPDRPKEKAKQEEVKQKLKPEEDPLQIKPIQVPSSNPLYNANNSKTWWK